MAVKHGLCTLVAAASLLLASVAVAHDDETEKAGDEAQEAGPMMQASLMQGQIATMPGMDNLVMLNMDPALGRKLFASKGCVACHSINGVGGHDATPLDAHTMQFMMHPFEFAAKMWTMAPYMIAAQEEALGEQITFTGEELAHIIAFVHNHDEQHHFSEADIPPEIWPMMHHEHGDPGGVMEHAAELGHMGDDDHHTENDGDEHQDE